MRATALALLIGIGLPAAAHANGFEDGVLTELNRLRANPAAYARDLQRSEIRDEGYGRGGANYDDPEAVDDAVDFLMRQAPLPPLSADRRVAAAAQAHVAEQGYRGDVGHGAPGSLGRRLQQEGVWAGLAAETISYGQGSPRAVIRQLVIDSGVPNRAHRKDLFDHNFQVAGVGCGEHAAYGVMCVIDFAGALVRRGR
jgi:hypothetical protein